MGRVAVLALAFLGLLLLRADAGPERRVALVIGNGTYEEGGILANPVNDAADIAAKLRDLGFEVIAGNDLGKRALERKIGEFSDALEGAGVGMFYYAGHGLQVDGRNFIVPVDAKLDVPAKLRLETVQIDDILDIMEQKTKTSLVFLDACRNNPFVKSLKRLATNRSAVPLAGLAQFDSTRGSFIAFSTAPGSVALDGAGRNSPFAAALIKHMGDPGQSINDLMIAVRRDVVSETGDAQRPWEQGSLLDRFEFVPGGEAAAAPAAEAKPEQAKPAPPKIPTRKLPHSNDRSATPRRSRISCAPTICPPIPTPCARPSSGSMAIPRNSSERSSTPMRSPGSRPTGSRSSPRGRWCWSPAAWRSRNAANCAPMSASR